MNLITLDFETFYSQEFSLSKITTEAYIRDPQFQTIGVGVKVNDGETEWASGTHGQLKAYLQQYDWDNAILLGQNTMFDGAILSWLYDIHPAKLADTMYMSRAMDGLHVGHSLAKQAERNLNKKKGTEVIHAKGKRLEDFSEVELARYGDYCILDCDLTYELFRHYMRRGFPKKELSVIDMTLKMFTEPTLQLDLPRLETHLINVVDRKAKLLEESGVTKEELMSNNRFAEMLEGLGVIPPMKISPATGKRAFAFAKTDEGLKALQDHPDDKVQALVEARLGNKSTLEETRTNRFIGIARRGLLPGPISYYAAHTGRWGGTDKINLQNLPSRGPNGKVLKKAIMAPDGYMCIVADSAQIEARIVAWLAGQTDMVNAFATGEDNYIRMAAKIYNKLESDVTAAERFIGKMTVLGCGYGMGAAKFQDQLRAQAGIEIELQLAKKIVHIYRSANNKVKQLWYDANDTISYLANGQSINFGRAGVLTTSAKRDGIVLPNGLVQLYTGLCVMETTDKGPQYGFMTRKGIQKIYGGKLVENICQGLAKIVMADQMLLIKKKYPIRLTVHDSVVICVPEAEVAEATEYVRQCMSTTPTWADGLPLSCDVDSAKYYGDCDA